MEKQIVFEFAIPAPTTARPDGQEHYRVVIEPHDPITVCNIYSQHDPIMDDWWSLRAYGFSHRRPADIYDRETGCRLALTSACRKLKHSDAKVKPQIWQLYLEKFPVKERTDQEKLFEAAAKAAVLDIGQRVARSILQGMFTISA